MSTLSYYRKLDRKGKVTSEQMRVTKFIAGGKGSERGVAVLLRGMAASAVIGYRAVSDRIISVRIGAKPFNITVYPAVRSHVAV